MEYLLTGFSPAVDAFAFTNRNWSIDEDEAAVILDVVMKAAVASLAIRPPLVDAVFDTLLFAGPLLAIPQVQEQLVKWLANNGTLDAANPAFCCGMCFCALDAYTARVPSTRGVADRQPTRHGTPQEAALRKQLLGRHLDAWKSGAAWNAVETKFIQRTQDVGAVRKRSAREVARIVTSLRNDVPLPILIHQDDSDPFSSHCLVVYGALVHPPVGDAQDIELFVYDPNAPVLKSSLSPTGWTSETLLKVTLEGGLAAPRSVRALGLTSSPEWRLVGVSITPYAPAAPAPSLVESSARASVAGRDVNVTFSISNVGTGEVGPFVVGGRASVVTAAPGTHDTWPQVSVPKGTVGGVRMGEDGPAATPGRVVIRVPPTYLVKDRTENLPQLVAPGTAAGAEVTFASVADVIRVSSVLKFSWRSQVDALRDPLAKASRSYERRAPGAGVVVRPSRAGGPT